MYKYMYILKRDTYDMMISELVTTIQTEKRNLLRNKPLQKMYTYVCIIDS